MTEKEITITVDVDASPEVVFKTISDPKELTKWFPDEAALELRVGGKYRVSFLKDSKNRRMKLDRDFNNEGKVLEIIQNKKLVHTWQWKAFSGFPETVVSWELEQINQNKTRLTLAHTGFTGKEEGPASVQEHKKGWSFFLNELVSYCKEKN